MGRYGCRKKIAPREATYNNVQNKTTTTTTTTTTTIHNVRGVVEILGMLSFVKYSKYTFWPLWFYETDWQGIKLSSRFHEIELTKLSEY